MHHGSRCSFSKVVAVLNCIVGDGNILDIIPPIQHENSGPMSTAPHEILSKRLPEIMPLEALEMAPRARLPVVGGLRAEKPDTMRS